MLERNSFVLRLLSAPHEVRGLPVRFGNEVKVWTVRYLSPGSEDIYAFFHLDIPLPGVEDVWEYAYQRGVVVEAEEVLQRAKDKIIAAVHARMPWAKFCPIRIAPDNVSISPGRTVLIYRRTTSPSARITKSDTRLSVLTFSDRLELKVAVPPIPEPILVESRNRKRKGESEVLLVSEELLDFLVHHHDRAKKAEARAREAYVRLSEQMPSLETTIRAIREWTDQATFSLETEEDAAEEGEAVSWRKILAKKLNTSPDRLVVSGPAVFFNDLGRWALISIIQVEGRFVRVQGESETWSFRFPTS